MSLLTHRQIGLSGVWKRRRAKVAFGVLGWFLLLALFADLVASDGPLFGIVDGSPTLDVAADRAEWTAPGSLLGHGPSAKVGPALSPPSSAYWFGTDEQGRDVLARVVHGTRGAVVASTLAVMLSVLLGVGAGTLAGSGSSRWSTRLDRLLEMVDTFPAILVVALLRALEASPSVLSVAIGVTIVKTAEVARIVRAEGLRISTQDHVLAGRALGGSRFSVMRSHVLPQLSGPIFVTASLGIASVTLLETAVCFLGLGAPPVLPSWGELLSQAAQHPEHVGLVLGPGVAIVLTVGAAQLLSSAARESFAPRRTRF